MLVAIISDIHDNIPNLKKVLDFCAQNKIEKIVCCGDLASIETLDFLNDNFSGEIFYTFGNMDNAYLKNYPFSCHPERSEGSRDSSALPQNDFIYKHTKIFKNFGEVEIENKKIAFVHFPKEAHALCETGKYDFVFHGHTHKPWSSEVLTKETKPWSSEVLTKETKPWSSEVLTKETMISKKCILLSPGNVANQIYAPTFATWNVSQNNFNLIKINDLK